MVKYIAGLNAALWDLLIATLLSTDLPAAAGTPFRY
jgi:hypothetical protein